MKVNMIIALNSLPIRLKNNLKNLQRDRRKVEVILFIVGENTPRL